MTRKQLSDIRRTVELMPSLSRRELTHTICEHLGWRASSGEDSTYSALRMIETLEREGFVSLPAKDESSLRSAGKAPERTAASEPGERIECDLSELGEVVLEPIHTPDQVRLFNKLGYRQPVGCHLRYLVLDGPGRRLGCLQFQRASKKLQSREAWIGWDEDSRQKRLERVVCNSRLLILPWVRSGTWPRMCSP